MRTTPRRVLVVGASGFLGSHMARALAAAGHTVFSAGRNPAPGTDRSIKLDATDLDAYQRVLSNLQPDQVVHLTSDSRGGLEVDLVLPSVANDVVASVNCLIACTKSGVGRVLLTTSMEEPVADEPAVTPYAAAKHTVGIYGKMFRKAYGLDVRLVRPFLTYGPGQKAFKLVPLMIDRLLRGQDVHLKSPHREIDWIYVDDTVAGMERALAHEEGFVQPVDIGSGQLMTIATFVSEIARQLGCPELVHLDGVNDRGREMVRRADTATTERLIGWRASVSLEDGIGRTIASHRQTAGASLNHPTVPGGSRMPR